MWRQISFFSLLLCVALSGCGGGEIAPTDQQGGIISAEAEKKGMQESLDHMPPEARKRMEQQMQNLQVKPGSMPAAGGAPGGTPPAGTTP